MKILAIDPGFGRVGIAVLEHGARKHKIVISSCFTTENSMKLYKRIELIGNEVEKIIDKFSPRALAIETLYFNTNQKTAMSVAEARGVIIYQAIKKGLSIYEYTPLAVKCAVAGYGKATKKQITEMVKRLTDIEHANKTDDEYDAIAVGITCFASEKLDNDL
jgi:crossover junction endodeoxyribonuclease RuvC